MAIAEHEIMRPLNLSFTQEQRKKLESAALAAGQSLESFAASALLSAANETLTPSRRDIGSAEGDPLDRIAGIFRDEPLMDDLMERIREDRRVEIEAIEAEIDAAEIEAEARKAGALG
jgi:hypothetical protein